MTGLVHYSTEDGLGNVQPVGPTHPLPVTGTFTGGNAAAGTNGAAAPTSSSLTAYKDGSGNLQPVTPTLGLPVQSATAGSFVDGWDVTEGTKADAAYAGSGSATVIALLKGLYNAIVGPVPPATTGGLLKKRVVTNALTAVKASAAGQLYGAYFGNPNASIYYVQIFDLATTGAVTLGTTVPDLEFMVPASGGLILPAASIGTVFANGIIVASTTTSGGSTTTGTALVNNFFYF